MAMSVNLLSNILPMVRQNPPLPLSSQNPSEWNVAPIVRREKSFPSLGIQGGFPVYLSSLFVLH